MVYECTKHLVYEKVITEYKKPIGFIHETVNRGKK